MYQAISQYFGYGVDPDAVLGAVPQCVPDGESDFSDPYGLHNWFGLEADDLRRMHFEGNKLDGMLSDSGIRAILNHHCPKNKVPQSIALFDSQWLYNWVYWDLDKRREESWKAYPRPLHNAGPALERIILPFFFSVTLGGHNDRQQEKENCSLQQLGQ